MCSVLAEMGFLGNRKSHVGYQFYCRYRMEELFKVTGSRIR